MDPNNFQKRINYQGDLKPLFVRVCQDFNLGQYQSHQIIPIGYEDFNVRLITNNGSYFVKVFGAFRDENECQRYINIILSALRAGVSHPKLHKSSQGLLCRILLNGVIDRLCVMDYINGRNLFELKTALTDTEMKFLIKQAALINKIKIKPSLVYDHWAITNFLEQYAKKEKYLDRQDNKLIAPLVKIFEELSVETLPHCFVHGDITKTNTLKDTNGRLYIIDFAVANYYPRIQELAVLLCDLFFDPQNSDASAENYAFVLNEYQKYIKLTSEELAKLPAYVELAHAMHVLCATYEKVVNKNTSEENNYFFNIGKIGLRCASSSNL